MRFQKIDKKLGIKEKKEKFKEKLPKFEAGSANNTIGEGVNKLGGKLKKGGLAYTISASACIAVKNSKPYRGRSSCNPISTAIRSGDGYCVITWIASKGVRIR